MVSYFAFFWKQEPKRRTWVPVGYLKSDPRKQKGGKKNDTEKNERGKLCVWLSW